MDLEKEVVGDATVDAGDTAVDSANESSSDWEFMLHDDDVDDEGNDLPKAEPPTTESVEPAPAPATEPVAPEAPQAVPPPTPPVETPPAPPVQQEPPAPAPEVDRAALREKYVEDLAKNYQLSDEDALNLVTNPNAVLPKLAANLQATVMEQASQMVVQVLQQTLPNFIEGYQQRKQQEEQGEQEFFGQWEELKPHRERVFQLATMYRQMNPQATKEQFIRDVGMQAWFALGMPVAALEAKLNPAPRAPEPPPPPPGPMGYVPASPGAALPNVQQRALNPYDQMLREWEEDL